MKKLNFILTYLIVSLISKVNANELNPVSLKNLEILQKAQKISYFKNPCYGIKNVHFSHFIGFRFEDGKVYKLRDFRSYDEAKQLSLISKGKLENEIEPHPGQYKSILNFLESQKVCQGVDGDNSRFSVDYSKLFFIE
ncbi:MAG: hypothetical protein L6Q37_09005 [Bdellovibrionaceae bacterium]|nr:hypothetical protein [Pseudobdellovibrionaceae bacterium]NUM59652.1 hypothetical protein [Pseudobdellovibrionaceae bacterium]